MNVHDVTELIWHFAGLIRLNDDFSRNRVEYEDAASKNLLDDPLGHANGPIPANGDLEESESTSIPPPALADPASDLHGLGHIRALHAPDAPDTHGYAGHAPMQMFVPHGGVGGGGGGGRAHGGDPSYHQTQLDVHQSNVADDRDQFQTDPQWNGELPIIPALPGAELLAHATTSAIPADLVAAAPGPDAYLAFARSFDDSGNVPTDPIHTTVLLNGQEASADVAPPSAPVPPSLPDPTNGPTGDLGLTTQAAELGANVTSNGALIVDGNGACGTLVVLGDRIAADIIVQVNVHADDDAVVTTGAAGAAIADNGNVTDNLAKLTIEADAVTSHAGSSAPLRVDVVDGDFYGVQTVFQSNVLCDDDVVVQTSTGYYSLIQTGDNELANIAEIRDFNIAGYYDAIVIGGSIYDLNVVVQFNLLLDNDAVALEGGSANAGSIYTDGNVLSNHADVTEYGVSESSPLPDGTAAYASTLADANPASAPSLWGLSDGGDGFIDILYVTGDYYDLKLIWQVNVVSDCDIALQQADPNDTTTTQVVSTGANALQNEAIIVDVGAQSSAYVGGQVYDSATLIQSDIVVTDGEIRSDARLQDTETLVPELIAFTDEPQTIPSDPGDPWPATTMTDHLLGNLMS